MQLNPEQMAAVQHPLGKPAILLAGAGSGKTRVLTERVKWLMENGVTPKRILAVTFTNKAAKELRDRLNLDETSHDIPCVSTIHSLALSVIRRSPKGFGLQEKVTPLDDYDQTQMIRKIIDQEVPKKDGKFLVEVNAYKLLDKIGFHRARGIGFAVEYTEEVHERALIEHAGYHALEPLEVKIWSVYENWKQTQSMVDFDDMVWLVVRRGEAEEKWRSTLHKYDCILQDESQDTSPIQWRFLNLLLAPDNFNLTCVGDLSQSIYSFQGANPRLLKGFSEGWRGVVPTLYSITKNHRSLPRIIKLANRIQASMTETLPLQMALFRGLDENGDILESQKGVLQITKGCLPSDVANNIAAEISRDNQRSAGRIPFKDNAILVRSAMQVRDLEGALVKYRIPYQVRGGKGLLQTEEIRDILAYLRLITNPKDFMALVRAVAVPKRGVGDVALEKIRRVANESYDGDLILGSQSVEKLGLFVQTLQQVQKFRNYPVQALEQIVALTGYKGYIESKYKNDSEKVKSKLDNIDRLLELVRGLVTDQEMTTEDLVFQLTLDRAREDDKDGMVTISTIHGVKGLEFPRVYLAGLVDGMLPHVFSMGSDSEIEEERRVFYTAVTRARDSLTFCVHSMEQRGSNVRAVQPSRFLTELKLI